MTGKGPTGARDAERIAVCIATFRRPQLLAEALRSIARQRFDAALPAPAVQVLVADNDPAAAGLAVVEAMAKTFPWPLRGLSEPRRGISFARNALVAAAAGCDYVAFIDDDETADEAWLSALYQAARTTGAEAVLGPVRVRFEETPPAWLRAYFERKELPDHAPVPDGFFRTGNILLRASALQPIEGPFDPAFAVTGGSDYMLGQWLSHRGGRAVWAAHAIVSETLPASRATFRWYMQRRYRSGMTFSMAQQRIHGPLRGGLRGAYRGAGSLAAAAAKGLRALPFRDRLGEAAGLMAYGAGNLAGVIGARYEEYRTTHGR